MRKNILFIILFFSLTNAFAKDVDFSTYFAKKSGCFILFNLNKNKTTIFYNSARCSQRIPPDSTFKIPLSLMAFDQKIISQSTIFKWDGKDRGLTFWNQDQTPKTWLQNSAVWVSQELTPKLGLKKIKNYLRDFDYGNQDFSGDAGKNNGLTEAWLGSSLKISANEQLEFLKKLAQDQLPVSTYSMVNTKQNLFLEDSPHGWKLSGKTGSGAVQKMGRLINSQYKKQDGWFIGFVQKNDETYILVLNFTDLIAPSTDEAGGTRAKKMAKAILADMGVW